MSTKKIHCQSCKGTGKINVANVGKAACLDCIGTGIVEVSQAKYDEITQAAKKAEIERLNRQSAIRHEELTNEWIESERERNRERADEIYKNEMAIVWVIVFVFIIILVILLWTPLMAAFKNVFSGLLVLAVVIFILSAALSSK